MSDSTVFEKLQSIADDKGVAEGVQFLISHFRETGEHHQLFEALKMKVRLDLGLQLLYGQSADEIDEEQQRALEDGLLDACREVGTALIEKGELREGWMYLQPLGDRRLITQMFDDLAITESNLDDVIEIGLSQGAAPELGYRLLLEEYGTCNAITTFDTQVVQFEKPVQQKLAALLVNHIYGELVTNVANHVAEQEGQDVPDSTLTELTSKRAWLTANGAHHVDTTHLASMIRIGRIVDRQEELKKLLELAEYGQSLDKDFHYPGNPPFEDTYHDHALFYRALTGEGVEIAIQHFQNKIELTDELQFGTVAVETLIDLLFRTGQTGRALALATESLLGKENQLGIAPNVFEMANTESELATLINYYRQQNDVLGFSVGLFQSKNRSSQ